MIKNEEEEEEEKKGEKKVGEGVGGAGSENLLMGTYPGTLVGGIR